MLKITTAVARRMIGLTECVTVNGQGQRVHLLVGADEVQVRENAPLQGWSKIEPVVLPYHEAVGLAYVLNAVLDRQVA